MPARPAAAVATSPALLPEQEYARRRALAATGLFDTPPEERFDRLTSLAAQIFDVPMALLTLVDGDRLFFKSRHGLELTGAPREHSFCDHAIAQANLDLPFVVTDARADARFAQDPLVAGAPYIRTYVGQAIRSADGHPLGTLCILDRRQRQFERRHLVALRHLARMAENELQNVELTRLVAQLHASEERLRETENGYRGIFENLTVGVFQSTDDGRYLNANPALARIHGYDSPGELMTAVTDIRRQLYVDPSRREEMVRRLEEVGEVRGFEAEVRRRDGSTLWIAQHVRRVAGPDGRTRYHMGCVEDVTSRRYATIAQAQAAETALESVRLKSEFLANMSHEIRTPMHGIIGMAGLLGQTGLNTEQGELLGLIATCGDNLLSLINNILDFSKIESGAMEIHLAPHTLDSCLREVVVPLNIRAHERRVALSYEVDGRIPQTLVSDATWLRQILNNLVGNAIKFTPAGGRVDVSVTGNPLAAEDLPPHVADALEPYPEAVPWMFHFTVRDTGIGVPEDKLHRLFKPFSQADASTSRTYGGTGLGLAICHRLCEMLGGSVWLESEVGQGSSFEFTIKAAALSDWAAAAPTAGPVETASHPVTTTTFPAAPALNPPAANALAGLRILLTEDNLVNQRVALGLLRQVGRAQGADRIANNGQEAVAAVAEEDFDLILMDVQMPEMDGFEATRRIRGRLGAAGPYIIAMTANAMEGDREKCLDAGMDDYLSKPVKAAHLQAALEKAVLKTRPHAEPPDESPRTQETTPGGPLPGRATAAAPGVVSPTKPQAAVAVVEPASLDVDSLHALRNLAADGDEAFFQELVDLFLDDAASRMGDLDRTLAAGQAADFTRAAHSVKGACANFGATDLGRLCAEVEALGRAGNLAGAAPCLPGLRHELERVRLALAAETGR